MVGNRNFIFAILVTATLVFAGEPKIEWERELPIPISDVISAVPVEDGGFVLACITSEKFVADSVNADAEPSEWETYPLKPQYRVLLRLDANGAIKWKQYLNWFRIECLSQDTSSGTILVFGSMTPILGSIDYSTRNQQRKKPDDYCAAGFSMEGDSVYLKCHCIENCRYEGFNVVPASDGGLLYSAGMTLNADNKIEDQGVWLLRLNHSGDRIWDRTVNIRQNAIAAFGRQTADNGFMIGGYLRVEGSLLEEPNDAYALKLNNSGDVEWESAIPSHGMVKACREMYDDQDGHARAIIETLRLPVRSYFVYDFERGLETLSFDRDGNIAEQCSIAVDPKTERKWIEVCKDRILFSGKRYRGHDAYLWAMSTNLHGDIEWEYDFNGDRRGSVQAILESVNKEIFAIANEQAKSFLVKLSEE